MKETHIECMKLYLKEWYFFNQNYSIKIHESPAWRILCYKRNIQFSRFTHFNNKIRKGYYIVGHKNQS